MKRLPILLLLSIGTAVADTQDRPRTPVPEARPLMLEALRAPNGEAYGVLSGEMAEAISRQFSTTSPIQIDVVTKRRYRQAGCARLNVTFWQDGVLLPGSQQPSRQTLMFGIDYCLDGLPPRSRD